MKVDIGTSIPVKCVQLAILTGHPSDEIQGGHSFAWGKGMFTVESVSGDEAIIRRLASQEIQALDQTKVLNPSQFHELSMWENPGAELENPTNPQQTGAFMDPTQKDYAGGDTVPKSGVFPQELKSPRPGPREPKPVDDEVRTDTIRYSAINELNIDDPKTVYDELARISIKLHSIDWSNQAIAEMAEGDMEMGYVEYEDVIKDIIGEANRILGHMEESRQAFLRERGINPSDIK
jgi:hypothetical protein